MEFFAANIQLREVFVQLLAFVIIFLFLKSKVWKPVLTLLETRRNKIENGFKEIDQTKQDLAKLKADYDEKLHRIEEEARAKMEQVVQEGKKLARQVQDEARGQAKEILEKSKEDIRIETAKARVQLRQEIAGLAFSATERIIKEKLTDKKDEQMVVDFIKELEQTKDPLIQS